MERINHENFMNSWTDSATKKPCVRYMLNIIVNRMIYKLKNKVYQMKIILQPIFFYGSISVKIMIF